MVDDSSSEDDVPHELLQSVDKSFLNDSLFTDKRKHNLSNSELGNKDSSPIPPSLRCKNDENNSFTETGLTKSNQSFIAKRLTGLLDKKLEKIIQKHDSSKIDIHANRQVTGGVLLFSDSIEYLNNIDESHAYIPNKRKLEPEVNDKEIEARCKTVAVSSDWILSGAATKGWSKKIKGEVVHFKKLKTKNNSDVIECELIK